MDDTAISFNNATILIVEDNKDELEEYSELFGFYFKKCIKASNGDEGFKKFIEFKPDIILTDYKMPTMDGLQMSEKIRKIDKEIPIILNTVYTENSTFLKAIENKITSYIIKPTSADKLLNHIKRELQKLFQEIELKREKLLMQAIIEEFPDPIMVIDLERNVLFANNLIKKEKIWKSKDKIKCYEALYGYKQPCYELGYYCDSDIAIKTKRSLTKLHKNIDASGNQTYFNIKTTPLKDKKNNIYAILKVIQNKSDDISKEEKLLYKANYDTLTNLPNRTLLFDRLKQSIYRSNRNMTMFAILFIDLDKFKIINDKYGHLVGDTLLKIAAQRIKSSLRKIDTIARFGGDEFVVILENISDVKSIVAIINNIIEKIEDKFILDKDICVKISCSIGVDLYTPGDKKTMIDLIHNADKAMYLSKKENNKKYRFFKKPQYD